MDEANCKDILLNIPAKSISFALGSKKDDERNYELWEIIEIIDILRESW
jgi:hypothetical protein